MALLKHDSRSIRTDLNWDFTSGTVTGIPTGSLFLIKTLTASASASLSFVNGSNGVVLDSTYKAYKFVFKNIHPATDNSSFQFNASTDTGSNYNVIKTTTNFEAEHGESDTPASLGYRPETPNDLAQSTAYNNLMRSTGADNDQNAIGELWLYNPSSTTYVKHFTCIGNTSHHSNNTLNSFVAGYFNTTSAIDAIDFKFDNGNIDAGTISLYGLTT